MSEDTGTQSAENTSTEVSESSTNSESAPAVQTQSVEQANESPAELPFHEHPRFKEVIEQKNYYANESKQLKEAYQTLQSQVAQLQNQYKQQNQAQKPSYDPLFKELDSVNPQFASFIKEQYQKAQSVDTLSERLAQQEQFIQSYQQQQALSQFDRLCDEVKVDSKFKDFYKEAVANAANASGAPLSALPEIFKSVHERFSKTLDDYSRSITEKYVTQKTQDVKKPATQTGGIPASPKASQNAISRDDVKKQLAEAIRARNTA